MTSLRERFEEAAASPAPPSRLSADEVYAAAWHRRRVRTGLAAGAGAFAAVALAAALAVAMTGPDPRRETAGPDPTGSTATAQPSPTTGGEGFFRDGVVAGATATDGSHLYAIRTDCPTDQLDSCTGVLLGSDDAGQTWTVRARDVSFIDGISLPAPGTLLVRALAGTSWKERVSTDGGRTWTNLAGAPGTGTVQTVPAGGWLTCVSANTGTAGDCTLYAVDPRTGTAKRLAHQPAMAVDRVQQLPAGAGLWVAGWVSGGRHAAVSVSPDGGKTWKTHVFGPSEPDYPAAVNDESALTASLDGTTAYTVVSVTATDAAQRRALVYRTDDGGTTWQRTDPQHTLPWAYVGHTSYLAADGTHLVETVAGDPDQWYGSRDGGASYRKPAGLTGLTGVRDLREPVQVSAPGVYVAHDTTAVFRSTDGLHWTRLPLPAQPR